MQIVYEQFFAGISSHADELQSLLGEEWPRLQALLLKRDSRDLTDIQLADAIVGGFIPGPAEHLIRALMNRALAASPGKRSYMRYESFERYSPAISGAPLQHVEMAREQTQFEISAAPDDRREITVTAQTPEGAKVAQFTLGETYELLFRVDAPTAGNLASGETSVEGIPEGGLNTRWVVTSLSIQFVAQSSQCTVEKIGDTWRAEFDLLIPEKGASESVKLRVLGPKSTGNLLLSIYTVAPNGTRELYREVAVKLTGAAQVTADQISKSPQYTHLRPTHEWTTPAEHIQISVKDKLAEVSTSRFLLEKYQFSEPFGADSTTLNGAITNLRNSLESLREAHAPYLEDLDSNDLDGRLGADGWKPYSQQSGWHPPNAADAAHQGAFDQLQRSAEWRALASDGYALFERCFANGSRLRAVLEKLLPGSRIDFQWTQQSGAGFVSHVPWALMYMEPMGITSQVDPDKFLGLRFRIGSRSWPMNNGSVVLGGLGEARAMNLLYWGRATGDDVGTEADWQAQQMTSRAKQMLSTVLPDPAGANRKLQIMVALDSPAPTPVSVIYFYCHCSVGNGSQPTLRFGSTSKVEDVLGRTDLSQKPLADAPLIFANACSTAQADPNMTSELEQAFFQRGVRAFIGTEAKVPIRLASKFAWLYFQFLYRSVDPAPMSAGEALTQARMFLWSQYRNIGGLFYSISNQYDLFLASEQEVRALR